MCFSKPYLRTFVIVFLLFCCFSFKAFGVPITKGVGVSSKYGYSIGILSGGGEVNARYEKFDLVVGVMNGSADISDEYDSLLSSQRSLSRNRIYSATIDMHAKTAILKYHPMNGSFYIGFGGAKTTANARLLYGDSSNGSDYLVERMTVDRSVTTISIGNYWTPGGVVIGCEWVGSHWLINRSVSTDSSGSPESLSEDLTWMKEKFQGRVIDQAGANNVSGLIVHLGLMVGS